MGITHAVKLLKSLFLFFLKSHLNYNLVHSDSLSTGKLVLFELLFSSFQLRRKQQSMRIYLPKIADKQYVFSFTLRVIVHTSLIQKGYLLDIDTKTRQCFQYVEDLIIHITHYLWCDPQCILCVQEEEFSFEIVT